MSAATDVVVSIKEYVLAFGELLGILIVGVGIGFFSMLRKSGSSVKWSNLKSQKYIDRHSRIHELLTEMRITVRASRCLVFQFHNGGCFADGTSIKRFSVTHESCSADVPSMILESQDVLLTRYMELIEIMDSKHDKIIEVASLQPSSFRSGLEINSVECFSVSPLKCLDGLTPLGFICCHWCSADALREIEIEGFSRASIEEVITSSAENINVYLAHNKAGQK